MMDTVLAAPETSRQMRLWKIAFLSILFAVAAIRLNYCTQTPINSGDVVRNLLYGSLVNREGLHIAEIPLGKINPAWVGVSWHMIPYSYPILALAFFSFVCFISPTLFFAKLALTAVEAVNAWLIYRSSNEKWLALIYWCSPVSIWWVSREGQFEPLQSLFVFTGLYFVQRKPAVAFLALSLAMQVKMSALLLLPFFGYSIRTQNWKTIALCAACFVGGMLPTFAASILYPGVNWYWYSPPLYLNPYYWNFLNKGIFVWKHAGIIWVRIGNHVFSWLILAGLIYGAVRFRKWLEHLPSILFLLVCKFHTQIQFWYMTLFPSFLFSINQRNWRLLLFALAPLLDVYSLLQMIFGPFGYFGYFGPRSAFTPIPGPP